MNGNAPLNSGLPVAGTEARFPPAWSNFFTQLVMCLPWKKAMNVTAVLDFPSVAANSQSAGLTVTVTGARQGDAVTVTPYADTAGISYKALVTANNTVTVFAMNFTAAAVNPASTTFRILVIQD